MFFFRSVWHPHPCIHISQVSRGSFFPSGQCTEAASKARRLICMISPPSETGFHPIMRGRSASTPRIWYASLFPKPCGMYRSFRANSRNSYKVNNSHSSPSLRKEITAPGPLFLAAATTSGRPDYRRVCNTVDLRCPCTTGRTKMYIYLHQNRTSCSKLHNDHRVGLMSEEDQLTKSDP